MKRKSILYSVIGGSILVAALCGSAFAADNSTARDTQNTNKAYCQGPNHGGMGAGQGDRMGGEGCGLFGGLFALTNGNGAHGEKGQDQDKGSGMESLTASLVEEGIISQETADAMIAYQDEQKAARKVERESLKDLTEEERAAYLESKKDSDTDEIDAKEPGKGDAFSAMVEEGILTQDEADAIEAYQKEQRAANQETQQQEKADALEAQLANLVDAGLIHQDQADEIQAAYTEEQESRQAERESLKDMTEDERAAYIESKKDASEDSTKSTPGAELVEAGILTQDEVDAIQTYYQQQEAADRQEKIQEKLDALVEDGTITNAQAEDILTYLNDQEATKHTRENRQAYSENQKTDANNHTLQDLIDDGVLTQDEADAVRDALYPSHSPQQGKGADTESED